MDRIIDRIESVMRKKGITRYQIEKSLGIRQSTFKNWVNGTEPGVEKIVAILKYVEVSADDIFEIKDVNNLTDNERELLEAFRRLPERDQIKEIGKMEDKADKISNNQDTSSTCRTG